MFGLIHCSLGWLSWQALLSFHSKAQRGFASFLAWDPRHSKELQGELVAESTLLQYRGMLQRQLLWRRGNMAGFSSCGLFPSLRVEIRALKIPASTLQQPETDFS